ncbi:MAG: L,D-transpeptidase [Chloroflexia bacterium]
MEIVTRANRPSRTLKAWHIAIVAALLIMVLAGGRAEASRLADTAGQTSPPPQAATPAPAAPATGSGATQAGTPAPAPAPAAPAPAPAKPVAARPYTGKRIDVNLRTQTLVAYQGNTAVFRTRISSGVAKHPTVTGTYYIRTKLRYDRMTGGVGREHYDLPNVPYVMYFYAGYAVHGTYWHHNFGHPMSHGCVNASTAAAAWLYNWTPYGTPVTIHY